MESKALNCHTGLQAQYIYTNLTLLPPPFGNPDRHEREPRLTYIVRSHPMSCYSKPQEVIYIRTGFLFRKAALLIRR